MRRRGFAMAVGVQDPRFASFGNLFWEARRATPQRQNNGSEREEGCRRRFSRRPENCFGKPDGPAPSAKITERVRATAFAMYRGHFGRRPESCFGKPDGPAPSAKMTAASASNAPPPRLSRKLWPSPRKTGPTPASKRRELSGSPTGQTQAQTFDESSRRKKWHATRPGRVSANPKP